MKLNPLNNYAVTMAEINLSHNPVASEVILVLNDQFRDHYQDSISEENYRVKKMAIVKKDPALHYVQFNDTESLLEDTNALPWTVSMTIKDIYHYEEVDDAMTLTACIPKADDQLLIDGILYTISMVEPVNRFMDGLINCTVYPERSAQNDPLKVYRLEHPTGVANVYSVIYGGKPIEYSFDEVSWKPFVSYFNVSGEVQPTEYFIRNEEGDVESITL